MEERVSRRILCRNEIEGDYKGEKGSEKGSFRREKFFLLSTYILILSFQLPGLSSPHTKLSMRMFVKVKSHRL